MRKSGRRSIIGGVMALSLILMGTGYAYWTDTLNVTTKATTGELDVTFVDLGLYAQYSNEVKKGGWSVVDGIYRDNNNGFIPDDYFMRGTSDYNIIAKDGSVDAYKKDASMYNNVDFDAEFVDGQAIGKDFTSGKNVVYKADTIGSDAIELTVDNMYPGYGQAFRSDILNLGTLAARLSSMDIGVEALDGRSLQKDMLGIALLVDRESYNPKEPGKDTFKLCETFANGDNFFTIGGVDFLRLSALEQLTQEQITKALENNLLLAQPGSDNRLDAFIAIGMDPDQEGKYTTGSTKVMADNDDKESQHNGAKITVNMLWDQFNEGVEVANPNILVNQNNIAD